MPAFQIVDPGDRANDDAIAEPPWVFLAARALLAMPVDEAISTLLKEIGEDAGADRAWMFEYDRTLLNFRNTHEWCRSGVTSHVEDLQDAPVTLIAWLQKSLVENRAVMINDVAALPRQARALRAEMVRQHDMSVLCVPLFFGGRLVACIGFDATRAPRRWDETQIRALARCADLIALARYRQDENAPIVPGTDSPLAPLLYLRTHGKARGIATGQIIGLRAARDYTQLHLSDGSVVTDLRSISVWEGLLPQNRFLRIHRTAIVNLAHVQMLDRNAGPGGERWDVQLRLVKEPWTVSRRHRADLRSRLGV